MKGFLFDENLPINLDLESPFSIIHASHLGESLSDTQIWEYAKQNDLVIVTKDTDFSYRILEISPPPRVIHLRIGNLKRKEFNTLLCQIWRQLENLCSCHKLINVYINQIDTLA